MAQITIQTFWCIRARLQQLKPAEGSHACCCKSPPTYVHECELIDKMAGRCGQACPHLQKKIRFSPSSATRCSERLIHCMCSIQMVAHRLGVGMYTAQQSLESTQWNTSTTLSVLTDASSGMLPHSMPGNIVCVCLAPVLTSHNQAMHYPSRAFKSKGDHT